MPKKTAAQIAEWNHELRIGMHRSIAHFRAKLIGAGELSRYDREGIKNLLDLLEDYMAITWPVADQ